VSQLDSVEFRAVALWEQPDFLSDVGNLSDGGWMDSESMVRVLLVGGDRENFSNLNRL